MTPPCPTRSPSGMGGRAHHRPVHHASDICILKPALTRVAGTHPLLELLVDGVQCVLDGDAFEVPCCYLQPQWEVQVNLLDGWCCEELLEDLLVLYCRG